MEDVRSLSKPDLIIYIFVGSWKPNQSWTLLKPPVQMTVHVLCDSHCCLPPTPRHDLQKLPSFCPTMIIGRSPPTLHSIEIFLCIYLSRFVGNYVIFVFPKKLAYSLPLLSLTPESIVFDSHPTAKEEST